MSKVVSLEEMVAGIEPGTLVSLGGGGLVRKPLAACAALALRGTEVRLTAFLGGPDVDLLIGMGVVAELDFAYVGLDALGLSPNFRFAREKAGLRVVEWTEAMYIAGTEAATRRVPFMPTLSGPGADVMDLPGNPFARFHCPLTGKQLTAVPAIEPDVLLMHGNQADREGNVRIVGDGFLDPYLARAAKRVLVTVDEVVDRLPATMSEHETTISRLWVSAIADVPGGTGFTASFPEWPVDYRAGAEYAGNARDADWLRGFCAELVKGAA
jgi:acyl CoA:acetate/3-ketoacid CoA transferase alpha subunit